ncbi:MAG: hypothetical protein OXB92_07435 [Acidimicrobiaceae bacterium]|nr:hypothetical protein [Acidimicrobiia bacterium]MCY4493670.1 hypothetical protein [Acidimicrobiaceae bacterium]
MVNNYERILEEITKEAWRLAPGEGVDPELLVTLAMETVDLEDQHRIRPLNIKQRVEEKILTISRSQLTAEGAQQC